MMTLFKIPKKAGSTLLVSLVLMSLMITLGLGAARIFAKEMMVAADILFAEKAYFAAESGVEMALLDLRSHPVQHAVGSRYEFQSGSAVEINLLNEGARFSLALVPGQSQKFRMIYDANSSGNYADRTIASYDPRPIENFRFRMRPVGTQAKWEILCEESEGQTRALVGTIPGGELVSSFFDRNGSGDQENFRTWRSGIDPSSCFFSLQNTGDEALIADFAGTHLTPHKASVQAVGLVRDRKKNIRFDFYQKNLGSLFDFVFLHTDQDSDEPADGEAGTILELE